jgi:hypothetical protein
VTRDGSGDTPMSRRSRDVKSLVKAMLGPYPPDFIMSSLVRPMLSVGSKPCG